jgi:hypothetical protein
MIPLDSKMSPDLLRGTGKSIGGYLDVDDKRSEQHRFKPVQSLHHGSIGYQPVHTRIGLTKKAMSLQANREHQQEHERTISNCRWMISSWKLGIADDSNFSWTWDWFHWKGYLLSFLCICITSKTEVVCNLDVNLNMRWSWTPSWTRTQQFWIRLVRHLLMHVFLAL